MKDGCAFCDYAGPSAVLMRVASCFVIEPLSPCVKGHLLVIPEKHYAGVADGAGTMSLLFGAAVPVALKKFGLAGKCNVIVNDGPVAGQSIPHVHVHLVPRRRGDGLKMPWSR